MRAALLVCAFLLLFTQATAHPQSSIREDLVRIARQRRLAASLDWQRLLHYHSGLFHGASSDIDGGEFFLSSNGKHDADAELSATLRAFFAPVPLYNRDAHAICRFPARFAWLDQQLALKNVLHEPDCPALRRFLARIDAKSVSLVYAANSLEYPASAFGHTFLHLESSTGHSSLGGAEYSVDFQADTDTKNPLLYAFKGLTGLFDGHFMIPPAERKFHEYADEQDRDLWVFDLSLTAREVRLLTLHLWELSATHIDYFYVTQNCSYQILGALEAGAPRLPLTSHVKFAVLPMDTVKALFVTPRLVRSVHYVPSRFSRLRALREYSNSHEAPVIPLSKSPERGHGTMRFTLGAGISGDSDVFTSAGYRLALHDLVDPPNGHPELAQVQFLDTRLRYDVSQRKLTLDHLTFAELIALHPLTAYDIRPSWRARAYGLRVRDRRCASEDCFAHGLEASLGASVATNDQAFTAFVMADAFSLFSGQFAGVGGSFVSLGIGPHAGARVRLFSQTVALLSGTWSYLPAQDLKSTYEVSGKLRSAIGRDFAWGVDSSLTPAALEAELLLYIYF